MFATALHSIESYVSYRISAYVSIRQHTSVYRIAFLWNHTYRIAFRFIVLHSIRKCLGSRNLRALTHQHRHTLHLHLAVPLMFCVNIHTHTCTSDKVPAMLRRGAPELSRTWCACAHMPNTHKHTHLRCIETEMQGDNEREEYGNHANRRSINLCASKIFMSAWLRRRVPEEEYVQGMRQRTMLTEMPETNKICNIHFA